MRHSLPTDLPGELQKAIEQLVATPEVQGIVLLGSRSRDYHDGNADYDLEIIVDDPFYATLDPLARVALVWDGKPFRSRLLGDLLTTGRQQLEARRDSLLDADHWPYEAGILWYDRAGDIAPLVAALGHFPEEIWQPRLQIHYVDLWYAVARARQATERESRLNRATLLARATHIYLKFIFVLNRRWPPLLHRAEEALASSGLPLRPASDRALLLEALSSLDVAPLQQLRDALDPLLDGAGLTWHHDLHTLIITILGPTYQSLRERWSRY